MKVGADAIVLAEVAALLANHGRLRCVPTVEVHETHLDIALKVVRQETALQEQEDGTRSLEVLSLGHELEYLVDVASLRALCNRYDIDSRVLEAMLKKDEDQ